MLDIFGVKYRRIFCLDVQFHRNLSLLYDSIGNLQKDALRPAKTVYGELDALGKVDEILKVVDIDVLVVVNLHSQVPA